MDCVDEKTLSGDSYALRGGGVVPGGIEEIYDQQRDPCIDLYQEVSYRRQGDL